VSRRLQLLGGLFLALVAALIVLPPSTERQAPLTVYSAEPGGGKALWLWLEALGYRVTTLEGDRYAIGQDVSVVLLLAPTQPLTPQVLAELERWTRRGGRLIVVSDNFMTRELLEGFGIGQHRSSAVTQAVPAAPGRLDPALERLTVDTSQSLAKDERASGWTPLLVGTDDEEAAAGDSDADDRPILAARVSFGRGEVIALTAPDLLSNDGLRTAANARLALSLIGDARQGGGGRIAFDELHHGFGMLQGRSLYALVLDHAWGRTILLGSVLVLLFLLWRGRRFGRAVPLFVDRGRSLGELVTSQASLYRAGGKRAFAAEHLERQLRHDLALAVGLPADATDDEIAARARVVGRDPASALRSLHETRAARSDRALLAAVREGERARAMLKEAPPPEMRSTR
jgi:hypothetical protein